MGKLVILGIDALDPVLLERWKPELPNLARMMDTGYYSRLESTLPPDSVPAWVTIYTGMLPWQHGVIDSMDYLDVRGGSRSLDTSLLVGKTFWDAASNAGKRVCVINPLLAYPVWPVNGVMANGPVFITGEAQVYPPEMAERLTLPELGGMADFPRRRNLPEFLVRTEKVTRDQARFGLELLGLEQWDLFFLCFLTLDRVMHFLWRYTDPKDPTYPGRNPMERAIKRFFILFDSIVGEFASRLSPDQALLVVSDHGHGMRPPKALFLNEVLRREGLLKTPEGRLPALSPVRATEIAKSTFLRLMQRLDLEDAVYRIASLIPRDKRKSLKASSYAVKTGESLAWVSEMGGGTSFSGIEINRPLAEASEMDYEALRERIVSLLRGLEDRKGRGLVKWARRREEVLEGANVHKYPDVIFELEEGYGVDRTLFCGLTGTTSTHKKVSGGHLPYGVFLLHRSAYAPTEERPVHVVSVFPTISRILGVG